MLTAAIGYGLVAMFAGGISTALLKDSVSRFGPLQSVVLRSGVSSIVLIALVLILRPAIPWDIGMFFFTVAVSILGYFPFLFMLEGFREGKVGVVMPISSGWVVIAAGVGFVFFGESVSMQKLLALAIVVFGILAVSIRPGDWKAVRLFDARNGVAFALAAALLWGIVFPLFKITGGYFGALVFACIIESLVCISGCVHLLLTKKPLLPSINGLRQGWVPFSIAGILTAGYTISISAGYQTGEISVVSALAGSAVVVAVIVAAVLHHERLRASQYFGVGLVLLGTLIASMI